MSLQRDIILDPRQFVTIKPLPVGSSDGKIRARSSTVYSAGNQTREQVFWENYRRRQKQLTQQGHQAAAWRPYEVVGEPLCLEPKKLILESLGQAEETPKVETGEIDVAFCTTSNPILSQEKTFPPKHLRPQKRTDPQSLRKHLCNSRYMMLAVKKGRGYFNLLQEQDQVKQQGNRWRTEERRSSELRPPSVTLGMDCRVERTSASTGLDSSISERQFQSARPFTPVHQSLTSDQPQQLAEECIFRQLCCLNWLLESLTLDRSGRLGPVTSCWDAKDPGRSKNVIKSLNKEKAIQVRWEQFVSTPKSQRPVFKLSRVCSARPLTWKSSSISVMSSTATTSSLGSLSSLVPGNRDSGDVIVSSEDSESLSTMGSDMDSSVSEYLKKLLEEVHRSVAKEVFSAGRDCRPGKYRDDACNTLDSCGRPETHRSKSVPDVHSCFSGLVSHRKAVLDEMRAGFEGRVKEMTLSLAETLDRSAKKRWISGLQIYQSLSKVPTSASNTSSMTCVASKPMVQDSETMETTDRPFSTQWLSTLLSHLSHHTHSNRKVMRVLEKLRWFTEEQSLSISPHSFLRVLNSLQPWELCCPDLCVAIELVRENAVQMSVEEYDCWLNDRLSLFQSNTWSAPPWS